MIVDVDAITPQLVANMCLDALRGVGLKEMPRAYIFLTVPLGVELPEWVPAPLTPSVPAVTPDGEVIGNTFSWQIGPMLLLCILHDEKMIFSTPGVASPT